MSWTLPYDMFCILVAFPFRMIGWNWTEAFSLSLPFNLLFLLLLEFYAVWRIAKSLSLQKLYPYIVMILFLSPIIIGYSHLGRMTHHPFTLAISGFMIAETIFFIRKPGIQRGIILGFLMTLSCWESMETFPTVGLMSVFMLSAMLLYQQYNTKLPLKYFGVSVIISSIFALAIDYSPRGWDALIVDRYSVFHVEFLCLLGIVSYMIAHYNMVWRDYRTYLVIAISIFISIYIISSVHYPIDLNDKLVFNYFWNQDVENKSVFLVGGAWKFLIFPQPFGLAVLVSYYKKESSQIRKSFLLGYLSLCILECVIGFISLRLSGYSAMLLTIPVAYWLAQKSQRIFKTAPIWFAPACLYMPAILLLSITFTNTPEPLSPEDCGIDAKNAQFIDTSPDIVVASDIWLTPELLWKTQKIKTLAGPYHTNVTGIHGIAVIMSSEIPLAVQHIFYLHDIKAILVCTAKGHNDPKIFTPNTLQYHLTHNQIPAFLEEKQLPVKANLKYFLIKP